MSHCKLRESGTQSLEEVMVSPAGYLRTSLEKSIV
jgi:hypothetical protein